MLIVIVFRLFACAVCLTSQKTGITTGAKEAYASENGMMNSLQNGLKMLFKRIGVCTEVHVFTQSSRIRVCAAEGNELFVSCRHFTYVQAERERKRRRRIANITILSLQICLSRILRRMHQIRSG